MQTTFSTTKIATLRVIHQKNTFPFGNNIYKNIFRQFFTKRISKKTIDIIQFNDIIVLEEEINCIKYWTVDFLNLS